MEMATDKGTATGIGEAYVRGLVEAYLSGVGDTGDGWQNYDRTSHEAFLRSVLADMLIAMDDADFRFYAMNEGEKIEATIEVQGDLSEDLRKLLWRNYSARAEVMGIDEWTIHVKVGYVPNVRSTLEGLNIKHSTND